MDTGATASLTIYEGYVITIVHAVNATVKAVKCYEDSCIKEVRANGTPAIVVVRFRDYDDVDCYLIMRESYIVWYNLDGQWRRIVMEDDFSWIE